MKNAKITVSSFGNGSIEQVFEYANHGLLYSFLGDYALQGDNHPEMQAIDRLRRYLPFDISGDNHPEMQAIDRCKSTVHGTYGGDNHPEMQAIDRVILLNVTKYGGDNHPEMQAIGHRTAG